MSISEKQVNILSAELTQFQKQGGSTFRYISKIIEIQTLNIYLIPSSKGNISMGELDSVHNQQIKQFYSRIKRLFHIEVLWDEARATSQVFFMKDTEPKCSRHIIVFVYLKWGAHIIVMIYSKL